MNLQEYYNAGQMGEDNDFMWQDNETIESAGPDNGFSHYNNQGGFRRGAGYGMNVPQFLGSRGPPGRAGPPFMWGRGFGPAGPPIQHEGYSRENKPMRFLMRCGIPKQHLKALPKSLLLLMKPEFCGLCAQGFGNFSESSLHYISKNHIKNQKRWLAQQTKIGPYYVKEFPLKSRDLYCELCDVQITSRTHADFHYAGKLHRSVVDGRKNPRNPFLLQEGMEARVRQLIRREKKNLKPVQESEANVEAKKESKPIQPELYCEICKTSVTCTEQMTMHLNGKRHLNKEKQHILQMMKGDTTKNNDNPAGNNDGQVENAGDQRAVDAADATAQDGQNDDGAQDDYDWGNGSGTWDDDPQ